MTSVLTPENFNAANLSVSPIKVNEKTGAKSAYVNYGSGKIMIQTAIEMRSPYGLNVYKEGEKANNPDYSIDVSFDGYDIPGPVQDYYNMISAFDDFIKEEGYKNRKTWFKGDLNRIVTDAFYNPTIKVARDKEGNLKPYAPTQKLKLNIGSALERRTKLYDESGKLLNEPIDKLLIKGVTAIIECGGIWFAGSKFGVTWRATQIIVHKVPESVGDFAFVGFKKAPALAGAGGPAPAPAVQHVNDEDEDEMLSAAQPSMAQPSTAQPSAVAAMMPKVAPAPAPTANAFADVEIPDSGDEVEPVAVPKKPTITKKKVMVAKK